MKTLSNEKVGEILVVGETMLYALFPVLISYTTKRMPPVLFAGTSILVAAIVLFVYLICKNQLREMINTKALKYILLTTLYIAIIPSIFIFVGSSKTSGVNTTILLQSEIFFTFVIYGLLKYEKITRQKVIGAVILVAGTLLILFNGTLKINIGDLLIIAGTAFYPIGNINAKKALAITTPIIVLFIRSAIGGIVLIIFSVLFEKYDLSAFQLINNSVWLILLNGILVYCVSIIIWYEGIKRIDISKAILISIGILPAVSLVYVAIFLHEFPTSQQWLGFIIICVGMFFILKKKVLVRSSPS